MEILQTAANGPDLASQVPRLVALYEQGFVRREPFWEEKEGLSEELTDPGINKYGQVIVGFEGGQAVAMGIYLPLNTARFDNSPDSDRLKAEAATDLYLQELAVAENFRGRGLARQIVEFVIAKAVENQSRGVSLRVDLRNTPAIKLYEKLGFDFYTEFPGKSPFDIYARKNLLKKNQSGQLLTEPIRLLFQEFDPRRFLFFANEAEIVGWQQVTGGSGVELARLSFDGVEWTTDEIPTAAKSIWIATR